MHSKIFTSLLIIMVLNKDNHLNMLNLTNLILLHCAFGQIYKFHIIFQIYLFLDILNKLFDSYTLFLIIFFINHV